MKILNLAKKKGYFILTIFGYRFLVLGKKKMKPSPRAIAHTVHERPYAELCIFTCANKKYYEFAILYPIFALYHNKKAIVEIGIENIYDFTKKYSHLINFYNIHYPGRVLYTEVNFGDILPNSVRFVTQPFSESKYIYIGDIDIVICENILEPHLKNISQNNLDYSNIKRTNFKKNRLSGLHFIEYSKMYPILLPKKIDLSKLNDEELLFTIMEAKGYTTPDSQCTFRPLHGVHASIYNRPPLPTLTTNDEIVTTSPCWFANTNKFIEPYYAKKYLQTRYQPKIKEFMTNICSSDIQLRKIIQFIDMACKYLTEGN